MGADYIIKITGKDNRVISSSLRRFSGRNQEHWNWTYVQDIDVALDTVQMELEFNTSFINSNMFNSLFYISNWDNSTSDEAENNFSHTYLTREANTPMMLVSRRRSQAKYSRGLRLIFHEISTERKPRKVVSSTSGRLSPSTPRW